jgi:peptidoglycan/LPS O-acetylase OafA/YrhL
VEGLRAVAVVLVVLYHAGMPGLSGGYVGVDVFFVISGFVITGLLLRERAASGTTDLLVFYGRRCRRIIPAATLVSVCAVLASYHWLGFIRAGQIAEDARSAALFTANFHFISLGTNYQTAQAPPSPLQNYWSLSVEEQFYLLYPAVFILAAWIVRRVDLRVKLAVLLACVAGASFAWSVHQTRVNGVDAFFSPLTHAWELALGGLVAVLGSFLLRLPAWIVPPLTWAGIIAIVSAAYLFDDLTRYPGSAAALPVLGTAAVIIGGTVVARGGAESLLGLAPFRWLGRLSYSLYLWHWPLLTIAAEQAGVARLSLATSMVWVAAALGLSIVTYFVVENPIRHARYLRRTRIPSLALGAALTGLSLAVVTYEVHSHL